MKLFSILAPLASIGGYAAGGPLGGMIGGTIGGALSANEQEQERAQRDMQNKLLEADQSRYSWARKNGEGFVRHAPQLNYNDAATSGAGAYAGFKDAQVFTNLMNNPDFRYAGDKDYQVLNKDLMSQVAGTPQQQVAKPTLFNSAASFLPQKPKYNY